MLGRVLCKLLEPFGYTIMKMNGGDGTDAPGNPQHRNAELQLLCPELLRQLENCRPILNAVSAKPTLSDKLLVQLNECEKELHDLMKVHQVSVKLPVSLSDEIVNEPNIFVHLGKTGGGSLMETIKHSPNSIEVATRLKFFVRCP